MSFIYYIYIITYIIFRYNYAFLLYYKLQRYDEAEALYKKCLKIKLYLHLFCVRFTQYIEYKYIKNRPNCAKALLNYARLLDTIKKKKLSEQYYRMCLSGSPNYDLCFYYFGYVLTLWMLIVFHSGFYYIIQTKGVFCIDKKDMKKLNISYKKQ